MWLSLTPALILSKLSAPELAAMRTAATGAGQTDPLGEVLAQVTREVRGFVAACADNRLGPEDTIPDELLGAAINRARYELATRLPVASLLTDARTEANRDALAILRDTAACRFRIVPPPEEDQGQQALPDAPGYYGSAPKIDFNP
jgi:hypothetical protein